MAVKKLDKQLNCSICLDTYTDPKLLQCSHTYCTKCLVPLVRDRQGQRALTCPACRQVTTIPPNGVRGLQSAFQINELIEIRDDLKKAKELIPIQEPEVEGDATSQAPSKKTACFCSEHAGKELEFYCETCNKLICYKCAVKGGKHRDHDYDPLDEAFDKYKIEITSSLEPMEKQLKTIHTALAQLDTRSREISDQRVTIEASIHVTIRKLHEILDVRKTELIGQLHQMIQRQLKTLATQRDQMETIQAQLSSCIHFVNESLKSRSQGEVMKMKTTIVKQVKELTTPFQPDQFKPNTEADIIYSSLPVVAAECGILCFSRSPDPSRCHATGKSLEVAVVGEKSTAYMDAIDYNGGPCEEAVQSLRCVLVSELTRATVRGSLERIGQSKYEISYLPTIRGRHQLYIKLGSQHIRGSPFPVEVKLPIEKLGTPILTIGGMNGPWGITINPRGEVVVTEHVGHSVSILSPTGLKLLSLDLSSSGSTVWNGPLNVAIDDEGNILVTDNRINRIHKFTPDGKFLKSVGTGGDGPLQFYRPYGITFNRTNNKVYVVADNHHVQVLNSDLTFSSLFGETGSDQGQIYRCRDIACDSAGNVYVADRYNHRIQVFTAEGKFLKKFGRSGNERGELNSPISITIDTSDRVYVGDYNNRVSVFTSDGHFITSFGGYGKGPGKFVCPCGLAVDASGILYVCDKENDCIQLF